MPIWRDLRRRVLILTDGILACRQTPGCLFRTTRSRWAILRDHEKSCTPETVAAKRRHLAGHPCDQIPGCPYIGRFAAELKAHKKRCNPAWVAKNMFRYTPPETIHCAATLGCTFKALVPANMRKHEKVCTPEKVAAKLRLAMAS